jgi:DNA-binding response OmpR family regulator
VPVQADATRLVYSPDVSAGAVPIILVVGDPADVGELEHALAEPLPSAVGTVQVLVTGGGDDAFDTFTARKPAVVVLCATVTEGDTAMLVGALRELAPPTELAIVIVGDREGPQSIATGVMELRPDGFVTRPVIAKALRSTVATALEKVLKTKGVIPASTGTAPGTDPGAGEVKAIQRARWEALADSLVDGESGSDDSEVVEAAPLPPQPPHVSPWSDPSPPTREPTLIIADPEPPEASASGAVTSTGITGSTPGTSPRTRASDHQITAEIPLHTLSRMVAESSAPTIEIPLQKLDQLASDSMPVRARTDSNPPLLPRTATGDQEVAMIERASDGAWGNPKSLSSIGDRDSKDKLDDEVTSTRGPKHDDADVLASVEISDEIPLDDFDDDLVIGDDLGLSSTRRPAAEPRIEVFDDAGAVPQRDFARQLRAKMSEMAQRLFSGGEASSSPPVDHSPRHDHHTEIDLASLGEELPLAEVTKIEARAAQRVMNVIEARDPVTSPGSWDTHVRERGLPDAGEIVRGVSDAPVLLARMFSTQSTGRVTFKRVVPGSEPPRDVEKVVLFDQGRPVFASSSETRDRMGELLVREGKITASQYERCQTVVAESGRRMGEILVDLGYMKRRELLPAVRRHVEDIVYSLFGWDRGHYAIAIDQVPSAERIRLSRHPAALVLEGIRRKLDRTTLERMIGPPSTIIEVADRDRLTSVINTGNTGDLSQEERAALAAIDGQADLSTVARVAGVDLADVLPLAWGLCTLGLATARRTDTEVPDESTVLVGETDMVIDRERVRARWQLVSEADYFALLGVRRDATAFEIRRAYQSARRDFSPETFPADLRRELAQELDDIGSVLDEAFRVLRDDRLRGTYLSNLVE